MSFCANILWQIHTTYSKYKQYKHVCLMVCHKKKKKRWDFILLLNTVHCLATILVQFCWGMFSFSSFLKKILEVLYCIALCVILLHIQLIFSSLHTSETIFFQNMFQASKATKHIFFLCFPEPFHFSSYMSMSYSAFTSSTQYKSFITFK